MLLEIALCFSLFSFSTLNMLCVQRSSLTLMSCLFVACNGLRGRKGGGKEGRKSERMFSNKNQTEKGRFYNQP
jgi:hypothetical protein